MITLYFETNSQNSAGKWKLTAVSFFYVSKVTIFIFDSFLVSFLVDPCVAKFGILVIS